MATPEQLLCDRIVEVVEAATPYTVERDKLPRAAGMDGEPRVAVSPERAVENPRNVVELQVEATLQVYLPYEARPDETIAVDPQAIVDVADTLRRAFSDQSAGTTNDLWFLRLTGVLYPDDPTGNKTRLEATFLAYAHNPASSLP